MLEDRVFFLFFLIYSQWGREKESYVNLLLLTTIMIYKCLLIKFSFCWQTPSERNKEWKKKSFLFPSIFLGWGIFFFIRHGTSLFTLFSPFRSVWIWQKFWNQKTGYRNKNANDENNNSILYDDVKRKIISL